MYRLLIISLTILLLQSFAITTDDQRGRRSKYVTHVVNVGEDVPTILRRYEVSIADLIKDNPMININTVLNRGQIIRINMSRIGSSKEIVDDKQAAVKEEVKEIATKKEVVTLPSYEEESYISHKISKGETMYGLSKKYNVSILSIEKSNPNLRTLGLREGDIVNIPVTSTVATIIEQQPPIISSSEVQNIDDVVANNDISVMQGQDNLHESNIPSKPLRHFDNRHAVNISLLLPIEVDSKRNKQFAEFYQGFLAGLDSMKREGLSVILNVYNTDKGVGKSNRLLSSGVLDGSDIIIGPVYDDQFCAVASYAASRGIPIVSPLAIVSCSNPYIYQIAAADNYRYDKLATFLADKKVIFYSSDNDDKDFIAAIKRISPDNATITYNNFVKPEDIGHSMSPDKENVFVVAADSDQGVDMMLSKLSSVKSTNYNKAMSILGSPRFARSSIDKSNYFKLDVKYSSPYHIDRGDSYIFDFDRQYINTYNILPSLYSYRGFDVAVMFLSMMKEFGSDFGRYMNDYKTIVLQTPYHFVRQNPSAKVENSEYVIVNYTPSYNIIAK